MLVWNSISWTVTLVLWVWSSPLVFLCKKDNLTLKEPTFKLHLGVSKNRGTPKSSILIGFSIINHPFWGTPIFGNIHLDYISMDGRENVCEKLTKLQPWILSRFWTQSHEDVNGRWLVPFQKIQVEKGGKSQVNQPWFAGDSPRSAYESPCLANFCSHLCSFVWSEDQLEMLKVWLV